MSNTLRARDSKGFTILELIIVITIIGILLSLAFPVYGSIKHSARVKSVEATAQDAHRAAAGQQLLTPTPIDPSGEESPGSSETIGIMLYSENPDDLCVRAYWKLTEEDPNVPDSWAGECSEDLKADVSTSP